MKSVIGLRESASGKGRLVLRVLFASVCFFLVRAIVCVGAVYGQKFYQCDDGEPADVKVWAAESPGQADLWVFFTYDASDNVGNGVVYQSTTREEADFSMVFVESKKEADFSLWIVEDAGSAGWRNQGKKVVLDKFLKRDE